MRTTQYIYPFIASVLFAILVSFQLYKAFTATLYFDDASFAAYAKNLVLGNGYSVVYFNRIVPFHWGISLGPVVLLPAALMIALFGNTYWVPGLTSVLLIVTLLILAFRQLKRIAPAIRWQCAAFFLLSAMLLTNHAIGIPGENMLIWHALLGEVPSALLVIIATLYIAAHRHDPRTVFAGGVIAGLGALCKLLSLIGSGVLGLYLAVGYFMALDKTQIPLRQAIKNLFLYGTGVLCPLLVFEAVKLAILGGPGYLEMMRGMISWIHDFNDPGAGIAVSLSKLYVLEQYLGFFPVIAPASLQMFSLVMAAIGVLAVIMSPAAVLYGFLRFRGRLMRMPPASWAGGALLCCAIAHMFWFLLISSIDLPRYLAQGIFYGCAGVALLVGQSTCRESYKGNIVFALLALLLLYARSDAAGYFWTGARYNPNLAETQQVLQRLKAIQKQEPDTLIFSCGNAFEMEYLLPKAANFRLCDTMFDPAFVHRKRILLSNTPVGNTGKMLYGLLDLNKVLARDNPDNVKKLCPHNDIYAGRYYFISSCQRP